MDIEYLKKVYEYRHTKNVWRSKHDSIEFKECDKLNRRLFNKPLEKMSKCECVEIFFFNLQMLLMNPDLEIKIKQMNEQKFKLKKGKVVRNHNLVSSYTQANMTDEIAITLLKQSKSYIKLFESYPDNWEAIVAGKVEKTADIVAEIKEMPIEEDVAIEPLKEEGKKKSKKVK